MPKLIIHIIDSLNRGGAEILLQNTINILPEYDHLVIYFQKQNEPTAEFSSNARLVCLEHKGWGDLFKTILKMRKMIKNEKPFIVHSHLFLSSIIARLATPRRIPLINTLHSMYSIDAFLKNRKSIWAERITLKRRHSLIAVSRIALDDYLTFVHFSGERYVLYNFLPDSFFDYNANKHNENAKLKCVAVGNLKEAKNYHYLLSIMEKARDLPVTLDIYGEGHLKNNLENIINEKQLNVHLCGSINNLADVLSGYDLFIQASLHEGFGLSVIEAIAAKLPLFVSDIPIFREITSGLAHFFPLYDSDKAVAILGSLIKNKGRRNLYIDQAYKMAKEKYSQAGYHSQILKIYNSAVNEKTN